MKTLIFSFLALVLSTGFAQADDKELYDPAPPADSAFVRVINASAAAAKGQVGGVSYGDLATPSISGYRVVKAGSQKVTLGSANQAVEVKAGTYVTLALTDAGIKVFNDALLTNPAKAQVYFYNLSSAPAASVFAPQHKAAIVSGAAGTGASRDVNALKLGLEVKAGETVVKAFPDVQLKRRIGTSFLLTGKEGAFKALSIENKVER